MNIVDYEIVATKSNQTLVDRMKAMLPLGWVPQGGVMYNIATQQFCQAVVRVTPATTERPI